MRFSISFVGPSVALALLLGEACITSLSLFHPRVDQLFADYYITGHRPCWMSKNMAKQAAASLSEDHIQLSQLNQIDACYLLEEGWSGIERWGVWSDTRNVEIELPIVAGRSSVSLTIIGASPRNRQSIKVYLNGTSIGRFFIPNNKRSKISMSVPTDARDHFDILITIKHLVRASDSDSRELGVGLISVDRH